MEAAEPPVRTDPTIADLGSLWFVWRCGCAVILSLLPVRFTSEIVFMHALVNSKDEGCEMDRVGEC